MTSQFTALKNNPAKGRRFKFVIRLEKQNGQIRDLIKTESKWAAAIIKSALEKDHRYAPEKPRKLLRWQIRNEKFTIGEL